MTIEQLISKETRERFLSRQETLEERDLLVSIAKKVLGRDISYTCRNCYMDVLIELTALYNKDREKFNELMEEKEYVLSRGCCLQLGFGTGDFLVYQNCTKDRALKALSQNRSNAGMFETLPADWEAQVDEYEAEQAAIEDGEKDPDGGAVVIESDSETQAQSGAEQAAIEDIRKMIEAGETKVKIIEHFLQFENIGARKVSKNYISQLYTAAKA